MIINLNKIKDEQEIAINHQYDPANEQLEFDDCHYAEPITLSGSATRQVSSLHVKGNLDSTCVVTCSRCLSEHSVKVHETFELFFDVTNKHEIDITPEVREQMIFLHPQQYLCDAECKGMCPICGTNKNEKECSCSQSNKEEVEEKDSTFAKLKEMLNDREKEK